MPKESRVLGLLAIAVGIGAFGAQHWKLPTWLFVLALILAIAFMVKAIFTLPSMSWRVAKYPPGSRDSGPPDFVLEILEATDLLRYELATRENVENWIDRVFDKLLPWSASAASTFHPILLPETFDSYARRETWYNNSPEGRAANLQHVLESFGHADSPPPPAFDPSMESLKEHLDRLVRVID